jgi:hypothetical protein
MYDPEKLENGLENCVGNPRSLEIERPEYGLCPRPYTPSSNEGSKSRCLSQITCGEQLERVQHLAVLGHLVVQPLQARLEQPCHPISIPILQLPFPVLLSILPHEIPL